MADIIDGRAIARQLDEKTKAEVDALVAAGHPAPGLTVILVGEDPASEVYVRNKQRACERVGIEGRLHRLPADATDDDLLDIVAQLNQDNTVHGILVQLPLPKQLSETRILDAIHPLKDVDAFHPENVGLLSQGRPRYLPCTPHGVMQLLHRSGIEATGKHAVIVGRSDIVGKPMAMLLAARDSNCGPQAANATVTLCHSRSQDMASLTRQADILVAAVGIANFIQADMVKPGAAVIDVGINRTDEGLVGDVAFDPVSAVAGHITPVPGGVGPLTVTMLLHNTLTAAGLQLHSA